MTTIKHKEVIQLQPMREDKKEDKQLDKIQRQTRLKMIQIPIKQITLRILQRLPRQPITINQHKEIQMVKTKTIAIRRILELAVTEDLLTLSSLL